MCLLQTHDTADGVIPTLALVDEMHRHKSAALYGVFRDSLGARDGQMITISTAGENEQSALGMMRAAAYRLPSMRKDGSYTYARSDDGSYALHEWALGKDDDMVRHGAREAGESGVVAQRREAPTAT